MIYNRAVNALHMNLAGLKRIDTGQTLDQCRFPRTILPHQCMNLTLSQSEIHIVKSLNSRESHRYAAHGQYYIIVHISILSVKRGRPICI